VSRGGGGSDDDGACGIVRLRGAFETDAHLVLELELMSGGDLFDRLSGGGVLRDADAAALTAATLRAARFARRHGFCHRDIKLSNLIFPRRGAPPGSARLADFGMAGRVGAHGLLRGRCGTPGYVAPEILEAPPGAGYAARGVDAFSIGAVAYTALCGYEPFYGDDDARLTAANRACAYEFHAPEWDGVPRDARDLVAALLQRDPARRASLDAALAHPWLRRHS
ncbi:kinase-like domain-containing protein, partial [Tribonema minus]